MHMFYCNGCFRRLFPLSVFLYNRKSYRRYFLGSAISFFTGTLLIFFFAPFSFPPSPRVQNFPLWDDSPPSPWSSYFAGSPPKVFLRNRAFFPTFSAPLLPVRRVFECCKTTLLSDHLFPPFLMLYIARCVKILARVVHRLLPFLFFLRHQLRIAPRSRVPRLVLCFLSSSIVQESLEIRDSFSFMSYPLFFKGFVHSCDSPFGYLFSRVRAPTPQDIDLRFPLSPTSPRRTIFFGPPPRFSAIFFRDQWLCLRPGAQCVFSLILFLSSTRDCLSSPPQLSRPDGIALFQPFQDFPPVRTLAHFPRPS